MMQAHAPSAEWRNVISLAEYRQRISCVDGERPPPSPCPAAARRPAQPISIEAIGKPGARFNAALAAA